MDNEEQIIKNYKSILNNARANWIYEDYEILLKFWLLYEKETEKNKKIEDKIKGKINNLEIFRKTLPIRATEIERFIGELKDLLEE